MIDFDKILTILNTENNDEEALHKVLVIAENRLQQKSNVLYYGIDISGAFAVKQLITRVLRRKNMVKPVAYVRKQILMWQAEQSLPESLHNYAVRELLKQFRQYRRSRKLITRKLRAKTTFGELSDSYQIHEPAHVLTVYNVSPIDWHNECYQYDDPNELQRDKEARWTMFSRWVEFYYHIKPCITDNRPAYWKHVTSIDITFSDKEQMDKFIQLFMKGDLAHEY